MVYWVYIIVNGLLDEFSRIDINNTTGECYIYNYIYI